MALKKGYLPAIHGDNHHGHVLGCKLVQAWIEGEFSSLPPLSEPEVMSIRSAHNLLHKNFGGPHRARKLVLNFRPGTTFIPDGETAIADAWFPRSMGIKILPILRFCAKTAEMLLPAGQRKLVIY